MNSNLPSEVKYGMSLGLPPVPIFYIPEAFSEDDCLNIIELAKKKMWRLSGASDVVTREVCDITLPNSRLFDLLKSNLPNEIANGSIERVAWEKGIVAKYEAGQNFTVHTDRIYEENERCLSEFSLLVYLNDDFIGGETRFSDDNVVAQPRRGLAIVFSHGARHEGLTVVYGTKFIFHSYVMYARP